MRRKYIQNDKDFAHILVLGAYEFRICHQLAVVFVWLLFLSIGKSTDRGIRVRENACMSGAKCFAPQIRHITWGFESDSTSMGRVMHSARYDFG